MKLRSLFILALSALVLGACEDTISDIGSSIRPKPDNYVVKTSLFDITSETLVRDSIYVRTPNPLLGQISDNLYGTIRSDYAAQMRIKPGLNLDVYQGDSLVYKFPSKGDKVVPESDIDLENGKYLKKGDLTYPVGNKIDSMVLSITYRSYLGDSLSPMAVTVYELNRALPNDNGAFYSNFEIEEFTNLNTDQLGTAGYTGVDENLSDSIKNSEDYIPYVDVLLKQELSERFYEAFLNDPSAFEDQQSFQDKLLKGVYLRNTFGNGTILKVDATSIGIFYRTYQYAERKQKGFEGQDSTYIANRMKVISVTPDVVQLNNVKNNIPAEGDPALINNDTTTYITSPGGYYTQIQFPIKQILDTLQNGPADQKVFLNSLGLNMLAYQPSNIFSQTPPRNMVLLEKKNINKFFEDNELPDSEKSFFGALPSDSTVANYGYNFGNINLLVEKYRPEYLKLKKEGKLSEFPENIQLVIVPVTALFDQQGSLTRITNYFLPGGITLKRGKNAPKANMIFTIKEPEDQEN